MFDFLRIPGAALTGRDRDLFDALKEQIDSGTNEILIKPDWGINMAIVDSVNNILASSSSSTVILLNEVFFYIRTKLKSRQASVVNLMLLIVESIVKNVHTTYGDRLYASINDATFMNTLGGVVRKYNHSPGASSMNGGSASMSFASQSVNRDVAESAIDVVQAWGEAFLPHRDTFGSNIVKTYQDLRKEGFQFKRQYDPTRIPMIITRSSRGVVGSPRSNTGSSQSHSHNPTVGRPQYMVEDPGVGGGGLDDDMVLAAALQASMMDSSSGGNGGNNAATPSSNQNQNQDQSRNAPNTYVDEVPAQSGATGSKYTTESLKLFMTSLDESINLYKSCVLNSKTDEEVLSSDSFIKEIIVTIQLNQSELVGPAMNFALADASELVEDVLALNDKAANVVADYQQLKNREISREELMVLIGSESEAGAGIDTGTESSKPAASGDLLDLFDNVTTPTTSSAPAKTPVPVTGGVDLLDMDDGTNFNLMHMPQPTSTVTSAPVVRPPLTAIPKLAPPPGSTTQKRPSIGSSSVLIPPPPSTGTGTTRRPSHSSSPGLTAAPAPIPAPMNTTIHDDPFFQTPNNSLNAILFPPAAPATTATINPTNINTNTAATTNTSNIPM